MSGRIFLSYRREDSGGDAGRLSDRLIPVFGEKQLVMDVDSIPLGVDSGALTTRKILCELKSPQRYVAEFPSSPSWLLERRSQSLTSFQKSFDRWPIGTALS